jgi:hypothetical protein
MAASIKVPLAAANINPPLLMAPAATVSMPATTTTGSLAKRAKDSSGLDEAKQVALASAPASASLPGDDKSKAKDGQVIVIDEEEAAAAALGGIQVSQNPKTQPKAAAASAAVAATPATPSAAADSEDFDIDASLLADLDDNDDELCAGQDIIMSSQEAMEASQPPETMPKRKEMDDDGDDAAGSKAKRVKQQVPVVEKSAGAAAAATVALTPATAAKCSIVGDL